MKINKNTGQSLIEVVIALGIGIMIIGAVVGAVILFAQTSEGTNLNQTAGFMIGSFLDNISVVTESGWNKAYSLIKGEANKNFIVQANSVSYIIPGIESVLANDIIAGLVSYSKFDESSGNIAYDFSGSGNNMDLINSPTRLIDGNCAVGGCLQFNGSNNYIQNLSPNNFDFNTTQEITAAAWINIVPNGSRDYWMGIDDGSNIRFRFGSDSSSHLTWYMGQNIERTYSGYVIPSGSWHYVVFTGKKESGGNIYTRVYIDGVLKVTQNEGITSLPTTDRFYIGAARSPDVDPFNGSLDDVRIYDRALSSEEIFQLYNSSIFTRYFYIDNVSRDTNQDIEDPYNSANDDPSTQKITAVVGWTSKGRDGFLSVSSYITRWVNDAATQTDWSGGYGIDGPVVEFGKNFATSTNIDYSGTASSFRLNSGFSNGELISSIFDSEVVGGVAFSSIFCGGYVPSGGGAAVRVQIASSPGSVGPWNFMGPDGTDASYYEMLIGMSTPIVYAQHNNMRYFRYKIFLIEDALGESPVVDNITFGWNI